MNSQNTGFNTDGNWYRGNIHCHTTNSDGILSPKDVAEQYKNEGYNFLAFTDHNRFSNSDIYNDKDFIVIPGIEVDIDNPDPWRIYHVVGIQGKDNSMSMSDGEKFHSGKWQGIQSAQKMIDRLRDRGQIAMFNHPNWSRLELDDFIDLKDYFALEIYNYGCAIENHTALSIDYWDSLLRRGRRVWGVATDDCHHRLNDRFGGWVMVKASNLTHNAIIESLTQGSFYSSTGPEIYEYGVQDGTVSIKCSPVRAIHFVTYEVWGHSFFADKNDTLTSASHKLRGNEKYVRVECVDHNGNTAWTNPIFL